jgi:hypothetical protein
MAEDLKPTDYGVEELEEVDERGYVSGTKEERALVRKIDAYLVPSVWVLYMFSYMVSRYIRAGTFRDA